MADALDTLADELYDLRCALAGAACGEVSYTPARLAAMRSRVCELEPLAGERLHELLSQETLTEDVFGTFVAVTRYCNS